MSLSVVIPAKNEAVSLSLLLPALVEMLPEAQIIVVDDGSTDETAKLCQTHKVERIGHPYSMGNGAAIKSGVRVAVGDTLVLMDADGQHRPQDIPLLRAKLHEGFDMVVGARSGRSQAGVWRGMANRFYNRLSSWVVGHRIEDLTSGFRMVRRSRFLEFLALLPNGFSYPTTITMAFFRAGYGVAYVPIDVQSRHQGTASHIRIWRDGVRFLLIIFKIGVLYSPLKLFVPVSLSFFLTAAAYYAYTLLSFGRFTNMSALLFSTSVIVFLIGLVSEQITQLIYLRNKE